LRPDNRHATERLKSQLAARIDEMCPPGLSPSSESLAANHLKLFQDLLSGRLGPRYLEDRARLEQQYQSVGLDPSVYISMLSVHLNEVLPDMLAAVGETSSAVVAVLRSLLRSVLLDVGLVLNASAARAERDALTELPNRRALAKCLPMELERGRRFGESFALLVADVDRFKSCNDQHGHAAGDHVLRLVASVLCEELRDMDLVCRSGGDEFVVVLPRVDPTAAAIIAERIRATVAWRASTLDDVPFPATLSVGVAIYPRDAEEEHSLVARADRALYQAKASGRNRVCLYRDLLADRLEKDRGLLKQLLSDNLGWSRPIVAALDRKVPRLYEHMEAVTQLSVALARELGLGGTELEAVKHAALLSEVGWYARPDPWSIGTAAVGTPEDLVREHVEHGWELLSQVVGAESVARLVKHHHEAWDGTGHPDRLRGKDIPLGARIVHVADRIGTLQATSPCGYKLPGVEALRQIAEDAGRLYDPEVIGALVRVTRRSHGGRMGTWPQLAGGLC
jgi:diguanylate cyclase (GGDEF)-like protein